MSGESGYYCVIQYCPDRGREESANVGVLLYAPASKLIQARVGALTPRARSFFGLRLAEAARPNAAAVALAHLVNSGAVLMDSLEALETFVATRANDIRMTPPRLIKIINFTRDLEELYSELVEAAQTQIAAERIASQPIVPQALYTVFTKLSLQGRVSSPGKVRVPVLGRELDIPYAYRNGVINLVKPEIFGPKKAGENRAIRLGAEGQLLQKHPEEGNRNLIVVAGPGSLPDAEALAGRVLGELGVRFVSQEQAYAFAREVEEQAH